MKTPKLKNSSSYTFSPLRIPFNQQSTNNLLKQLQKSIINVEQIITKSKIKLGLDQNLHNQPSIDRDKSYSSIHFQMSPSVTYSNHDEFTYSISPESLSRIKQDKNQQNQHKKQAQSRHFKSAGLDFSQDNPNRQNNSYEFEQANARADKNKLSPVKSSLQMQWLKQIDEMPQISRERDQSSSSEVGEEMLSYPQYNISISRPGQKKKMQQDHIKIQEQDDKKKQKQAKVTIKKSYNLFQKYKLKFSNSEKKKYQTETSEKHSNSFERSLAYETQSKMLKLHSEEVENTCTKNQLQNMLKLTRSNRQKQKLQLKLDQLEADYQKMKAQKRSSHKSPDKKQRGGDKISLQKTPVKSKAPTLPLPQPKTASTSSGKKYSYANKYLDKKSPKSQRKQPIGNAKKQQPAARYSHPSKSAQKKKTQSVLLKQEMQRELSGWSREIFVDKMFEQCYVRRFLDKTELGEIYNQFRRKKIARFQWQQKLIQKIFQKIHRIDQLI